MANTKITVEAILKGNLHDKLKELEKTTTGLKSSFSGFGSVALGVAGGMSIFSVASAGFGAIKDEIVESEKASVEFEKQQFLLKNTFKDVGEAGDGAYRTMMDLAESSKLFDSTSIMEAEKTLKAIGNLSVSNIKNIMPNVENYATKWGMPLEEAANKIGRALQTGTIRPIRELNDSMTKLGLHLKEGENAENFEKLMKAMGSEADVTSGYLDTMVGKLQATDVELNKIREISALNGGNWFQQLGRGVSETWVKLMHPIATAQHELNENIKKDFEETTKGLDKSGSAYILAVQAGYNKWNTKTREQLKLQGESSGLYQGANKYLEYYSQQLTDIGKKTDDNKTKTEDWLNSYTDMGKHLDELKGKMEDELLLFYQGKGKMPGKEEIGEYGKDKGLADKVNDWFKRFDKTIKGTNTGEGLKKSGQIKEITINITKMTGIETVSTTNLDSSTLNQVGDELIKQLERAVFDSTNLAMTK